MKVERSDGEGVAGIYKACQSGLAIWAYALRELRLHNGRARVIRQGSGFLKVLSRAHP